jgi:nucleoside 2-deoxyribosyltransferase
MDKKFIDLLKSQIVKGEEFLSIGENFSPDQAYAYLTNKSSRWSIETENYLKYGIENQGYLTEFKACVVSDYNGNIELVSTFYKKLGYLNSFVKLLEENYISTKTTILKNNTGSRDVFVAMWFDEKMNDFYNFGVKPTIEKLGYNPLRVDEHQHNNKIDFEIIILIEKSAFLVADLTGDRGGVYYEAGYAKGLGIQVIYSVNRKELELVHFDIEHENLIIWNNKEEYSQKLEKRIRGTFGEFKEPLKEERIAWEE